MPDYNIFQKKTVQKKGGAGDDKNQQEVIVETIVVTTEEQEPSPRVIIVQQDQRDDNTVAMFFGLLFLMGLISLSAAFFLLDIHLFEYWPLWLGSLGVTSYLIVTSDRAENIIMGGMTAMSTSVGPLVINNNMSHPLINEQLSNGLFALSIFVWGFICYRYDNIWQITKTWMLPVSLLSLGSIFVFFYYG